MSKIKEELPVVESPSLQPHLEVPVASDASKTECPASEPSVQPQAETPAANQAGNLPAFGANSSMTLPVTYTAEISLEAATPEDTTIVPKTRSEYVEAFRLTLATTARSILEMCRVVYEANRGLDRSQFSIFCENIGTKETSSTIRKYIAIGKLYPRFISHAEELPTSWTSIYMLTQIPAYYFDRMLKENRSIAELKGAELSKLVRETREVHSIGSVLRVSKRRSGTIIGTFMFTKWAVDDIDWRAMKKAISEVEARLPLRFLVNEEAEGLYQSRKYKRYEQTKRAYAQIETKPDRWDFGQEANLMALHPDVKGGEKEKPEAKPKKTTPKARSKRVMTSE